MTIVTIVYVVNVVITVLLINVAHMNRFFWYVPNPAVGQLDGDRSYAPAFDFVPSRIWVERGGYRYKSCLAIAKRERCKVL